MLGIQKECFISLRLNNMKSFRAKFFDFIKSKKEVPRLVAFAAGVYPFIHYYSSNLSIADSWQQLLFIASICFIIPQILVYLRAFLLKFPFIKSLRPFSIGVLNSVSFFSLLGFLIFHFNKKQFLLLLIIAIVIGFVISKHIKKILVLQFLIAGISFVSLLPQLWFGINYNNSDWAQLSEDELNTKFITTPNIFVIQPDGYVNFSEVYDAPYNYDNSEFEKWLGTKKFDNYSNFRSNYYSTLTSNASMFAMKHHYYTNTNPITLKTHKANEIIVGEANNVLKILKHNAYKTHLFTDNSFFLLNRTPLLYDFTNISNSDMVYHDTGSVKGVDITQDFKSVLDTLSGSRNFFFIEKTIPSHIMYRQSLSKGIEGERINYIKRLEHTNDWLKELVKKINKFDDNALIIIVADHGGYVGFEYTLESVERKINNAEALSTFSSLLSIKWPMNITNTNIKFSTNVNLFKKVFYKLSNNKPLLESLSENSSFLPLKDNGKADYYRYINKNGDFVFDKVSD